ncbi:MAG: uracil-DNA glycosylase [Deltaproteobacteria bacterium]|nr:uracil-DNA glycosylase [Deltaproteobacteria bacterium]
MVNAPADTIDVNTPTLQDIRQELGDCHRCPLCQKRTHIVFGEGNPQARIAFVGEAPGADEDMQGRPFVGKAGQLLTKIIQAMGLTRQDVYICNILKCRPPSNRNPKPDEITTCEPFLVKQLQVIQPKVICALGTFAAQQLQARPLHRTVWEDMQMIMKTL